MPPPKRADRALWSCDNRTRAGRFRPIRVTIPGAATPPDFLFHELVDKAKRRCVLHEGANLRSVEPPTDFGVDLQF